MSSFKLALSELSMRRIASGNVKVKANAAALQTRSTARFRLHTFVTIETTAMWRLSALACETLRARERHEDVPSSCAHRCVRPTFCGRGANLLDLPQTACVESESGDET